MKKAKMNYMESLGGAKPIFVMKDEIVKGKLICQNCGLYLTPNKEYKVVRVCSDDMICIVNDEGEEGAYSTDWFYLKEIKTDMDDLSIMEIQIESLKGMYTKHLENRMERLMKTLQFELQDLRKCMEQGKNYNPNSAGIVQGSGMDIDSLCIKLGALYSIRQ